MDTAPLNKPVSTGNGRLAVWAITPNGLALGEKICSRIPDGSLFVSRNISQGCHIEGWTVFDNLGREIKNRFKDFRGHVFIFSTGIAVRMIASLIESKLVDPAVVVMDDQGCHAISLLSGHLGGANELAQKMAELTGAVPVITTATDVNQLPSIDLVAKKKGLFIETPEHIKRINMAFLENKKIIIHDPEQRLTDALPESYREPAGPDQVQIDLLCSWKAQKVSCETMILRPRVLCVGMGCNRNTPFEDIHQFFKDIMANEGLSLNSLYTLATIDAKKDESGLLALSRALDIPIRFYSRDELNGVDDIKTPSLMVEKHMGVKSVCEAAAILAAVNGKLILPKKKNKDITLAVAVKP